MPKTLGVKLGIDDREFSEGLEKNSRRFKVFGRELNEGAAGLGTLFGEGSKSLGKLGEGFRFAGAAAGIFAGADGLLGIGASLASGGLVLGGMAALTLAMKALETDTEATKTAVEQFNKEIGKIPQNARGLQQLKGIEKSLQGARNAKTAAIDSLTALGGTNQANGMWNMIDAFKRWWDKREVQKGLGEINQELESTSSAADDLGNALNTPEGQIKTVTEQADKLREVLNAMNGATGIGRTREQYLDAYADAWKDVNQLVREHGAEISKIGDITRKLLADFKSTGLVNPMANPAVANAVFVAAGGLQHVSQLMNVPSAPFGQTRIGNLVAPTPRLGDLSKDSINHIDLTTEAVKAGFSELPGALANVLSTLLASVFGNNRGAQIGGALGGAFGTGAGTFLGAAAAKGIGGMLGAGVGSVIPILGTAVGSLLGGAIGSLFGSHKRSVDNSANALDQLATAANKVTEAISNLPTGIKVAAYRYAATSTAPGPGGVVPPGVTPPGLPPGTGGTGVTIHQLIVNGVTDLASLTKKLGSAIQANNMRGGSSSMRVALNPVRV